MHDVAQRDEVFFTYADMRGQAANVRDGKSRIMGVAGICARKIGGPGLP